ncbi:MAG TPA: M48 family metallopeptidase [Chitinophagaceae bacterium]|nr:M48 family metallopeptidase [Chitinophagaceae bacterium]
MNKLLVFFILSISSVKAFAQLKPVYDFWEDDSVVKNNYYEQALKNKEALVASLGKDQKKEYREIYESRFGAVADLLKSSSAVTAPEAHDYLQSVLKKIVDANPELKPLQIRMVFSRDWWPNAYSMGEGTLVVNAGLMVFLDNEAELVFVLCHEIAHYYLEHSDKEIKKWVEWRYGDELQKEIKRITKEEYRVRQQLNELLKKMTFDNRQHSRKNESEADRQAFLFMKRTGYDCNGIITCLRLLDKVDDSLLFKPLVLDQAFNFSEYPFKKRWTQKESVLFGEMKDDDSPLTKKERDSLKTHPDCVKRIEMLRDSVAATSQGRNFIVNEQVFTQLKKKFLAEMTEQEFRDRNLGRNLYYNLVMLQHGQNKPLAIYSISRDLNIAYQAQKNHELGKWFSPETRGLPPDYNLLLRMLSRLSLDEIAALNYHFCKQYGEQMAGYDGFQEEMDKAIKTFN